MPEVTVQLKDNRRERRNEMASKLLGVLLDMHKGEPSLCNCKVLHVTRDHSFIVKPCRVHLGEMDL